MAVENGYRIPDEEKGCKFGKHWNEYLGERWMGTCPMFECTYEGEIIIPDNLVCSEDSRCPARKPCETEICPTHDIEHFKNEPCLKCHPEAEEWL